MKVAVIDYGMGNVFYVERALQAIGCYVVNQKDPAEDCGGRCDFIARRRCFPFSMQSLEERDSSRF